MKATEMASKAPGQDREREADPEMTYGSRSERGRRALEMLGLGQHPVRILQQLAPFRCECHSPAGAVEQLHAEVPLQSQDVLAQGRLGDEELRGRATEMKVLGDGDEVPKLTELHAVSLDVPIICSRRR